MESNETSTSGSGGTRGMASVIIGLIIAAVGYYQYGGNPPAAKTPSNAPAVAQNDAPGEAAYSRAPKHSEPKTDPWADSTPQPAPSKPVTPSSTNPQKSPGETKNSTSSVRSDAPIRDLEQDEKMGGHTLRKHVGRTDAQLLERLKAEPDISSASTWTDKDTAERCVGAALAKNESKIKAWLKSGGDPRMTVDYIGDPQHPIGRSIRHGQTGSKPCFNARVVLAIDHRTHDFFVLTTYPEAR